VAARSAARFLSQMPPLDAAASFHRRSATSALLARGPPPDDERGTNSTTPSTSTPTSTPTPRPRHRAAPWITARWERALSSGCQHHAGTRRALGHNWHGWDAGGAVRGACGAVRNDAPRKVPALRGAWEEQVDSAGERGARRGRQQAGRRHEQRAAAAGIRGPTRRRGGSQAQDKGTDGRGCTWNIRPARRRPSCMYLSR